MKKISAILITIFISSYVFSQINPIAPKTYLIQFKDKNNSMFKVNNPSAFLSEKSIKKKQKYNIPITLQDLPVNKSYVDSLKSLGLEIYAVSKWYNLAVVYTEDSTLIAKAQKFTFVQEKINKFGNIKQKSKKKPIYEKINVDYKIDTVCNLNYGKGKNQAAMLNIQSLHNKGFQGKGMQIAILDAGFFKVDKLASFDSLFKNNQILGTKDFVKRESKVYEDGSHGMMVLSTIGANIPGIFIGTAPKASFWLFRTEDEHTEYIVEEFYWVEGAECADSIGVDMIHSSLGYSDFDDKINSHTYKDMNGDITPISVAADIASSKGILVVTSAGNEGNDPWKYVSSPADADSVLAVGAVTYDKNYANFSSRGPSFDNRVKPDVVAQGEYSYVQGTGGSVTVASGTSFSGPIMAGAVACLWQANPEFSNLEIIDAVKKSCDQYDNPNTFTGFGIPNFGLADAYLKKLKSQKKTK